MAFSRKSYKNDPSLQCNEEWPEIISTTKDGEGRQRIKVAQNTNKETKTLDVKTISSSDDLKSIRNLDPFMYFSIPEARRAEMLLRDVDTVDIASLGVGNMSRSAASCPSRMQMILSKPSYSRKVRRKTRLSFESDPINLLMEASGDEDDSDSDAEDEGKSVDLIGELMEELMEEDDEEAVDGGDASAR